MQSCLGCSGRQLSGRFQFASSNSDMNAYASFVVLLLLFSPSRADYATSVETQATGTPKEPFYEPECLRHGGICMEREKCPPEKLSDVAALCPKQQDQGIDCCFGISTDKTLCEERGGMCRSDCPKNLLYLSAYGCKAPDVCCALV